MKSLRRWWHRFEYSVNMVAAYLASHTGEDDVVTTHQCAAYEAQRQLDLLEIQL